MADLTITISGDSKEFQDELNKVEKGAGDLENKLKSLSKISAVAFAALTAEAGLALHAFAQAEKATNLLSNALENQGFNAAELTEKYREQASALQDLTGIDDDAIVKAQALLQGQIGQVEITKELTQAILDLSEARGIDLNSAAEIIGKGINGQARALKALGIEIDDNLTKQERLAQVVEQVGIKFGGSAEAANKGLGSFRGLQSAFSDLQEEIGKRLAPTVTEIIKKITEFITAVKNNKPLLDLIVHIGKIAFIVTGAITAITGMIAAFKAASAVMTVLGLSVRALVGATGIGLLVILIAEIAMNWNTIWPRMQAVFQAFVANIADLASGVGKLLLGAFLMDPAKVTEGLSQIKEALKKGFAEATKELPAIKSPAVEADTKADEERLAKKKALADREAAEQRRKDALIREIQRQSDALQLAQLEKASADEIKFRQEQIAILKQLEEEKNPAVIAAMKERLNLLKGLQEEAHQEEMDRSDQYFQEILDKNVEYQELTSEQQLLFIEQNQAKLIEQTETEKTILQQAALEKLNIQVQANNRFLLEQKKFGTAYATVNQIINSSQVQGFKQASGELESLSQSKNATLKSIGKAAAIANITIQSAQAAMAIYSGFQAAIPYPPVSIPLGLAGAAAAIAFGAERIATVNSAAEGGIMSGGIPGVDSIPTMTMPGELVVPTRNFDEVVNAVANARIRSGDTASATTGAVAGDTNVTVSIGFDGAESERVLTARQVEARALGTYRSTV